MQEVEEHVSQVDLVGDPDFVELPELNIRNQHQQQPVRTETALVGVVHPIDFKHLLQDENQGLDEPAVEEVLFDQLHALDAVVELGTMSDVYAEQFLVNVRIFLVLGILYSRRVHQRAQRALDLHNWDGSLLDEIDVRYPRILFLILQEVRYPSEGIFDPGVVHCDIFLLV